MPALAANKPKQALRVPVRYRTPEEPARLGVSSWRILFLKRKYTCTVCPTLVTLKTQL